ASPHRSSTSAARVTRMGSSTDATRARPRGTVTCRWRVPCEDVAVSGLDRPVGCPDDDELARWLGVGAHADDGIHRHVDGCPHCMAVLEQAEAELDGVDFEPVWAERLTDPWPAGSAACGPSSPAARPCWPGRSRSCPSRCRGC